MMPGAPSHGTRPATMQLNQLRYFVHVAEMGSFSKAAVYLRIAQPALSRQVRLLEQELGVSLLYRDGRGAKMTQAGRDLLERSIKLFRYIAETRDAIVAHGNVIDGDVTIGVPPSVGVVLMPQVLIACKEQYPRLSVRVIESSSVPALEEWLVSGRVDLAILNAAAPISRNLTVTSLLTERTYLAGQKGGALTPGGRRTLAEAVALPLILAPPLHGIRMLLDAACHERKLSLVPRFEVDSVAIMKELASRGAGYTVLPYTVLRKDVEEGRLVIEEIADPVIERELLVATPTDRPPTAAARAVEQLLRQQAFELAGAAPQAASA